MLVVFITFEHIYLVKSILRSYIANFKHVFTCWEEQKKIIFYSARILLENNLVSKVFKSFE